MDCFDCGSAMVVEHGPHRYLECGLDYVFLLDVESRHCPACATREVALPRVQELHRVIARAVAKKEGRLTGQEVRFLRKHLGYSGTKFADMLGLTPETISRWENDHGQINTASDRFLRLMIFNEAPTTHYPPERLADVTESEPRRVAINVRERGDEWSAAMQAVL